MLHKPRVATCQFDIVTATLVLLRTISEEVLGVFHKKAGLAVEIYFRKKNMNHSKLATFNQWYIKL